MTAELPRLNSVEYSYLGDVTAQLYPADSTEFRAEFQWDNPRAPEFRFEGLKAMTDEEIGKFSYALRTAVIEDPEQIGKIWQIVCNLGFMVSLGGDFL
ncbi:hypothetical protein [Deinococcus sp. QL22]|uniref:hypothetical protein n=1 Tax=Deinococcus sp. QL22 TaxID=2939437 RepID=UPI0020180C09|nr:hypothetical protein [Deinococcus sp. QL22]UQN05496.1 hypothetical protein M1R55_11480 [Deinococcus sp. QL22]